MPPQTGPGNRIEDRIGIDTILPIEVGNVTGLTEAINSQGINTLSRDGAKPR